MRGGCLVAALGTAALLGCGGDDNPNDPGNGDDGQTVQVTNNLFTPSVLAVPVNSTVTWQWNSGGVAHNVTFDDGVASQNLTSGTYLRSFQAAGTFPYICTIHGEAMSGTVNVTASTGGTGGTGDSGGDTGGGGYP
jgi:plastocyanin